MQYNKHITADDRVVTNQGRRSKLKSLSYTSLLLVQYILSRCFRYRTAMYFLAYQQRTWSFQRRSRRKPTYSYFFPRYSGCLLSFKRRMPSQVFSYITIRQCSKRDIRNFQTMFSRRSSFYVLMQQNLAYCSFIFARMVFRSSLNAKFSFQKFSMRCTSASGAFSEALVSAICFRNLDSVLPFPSFAVSLTLSSQIVGICFALISSSNKYTFVSNQLMYALLLASCAVNSSHFFCMFSLVYLKRGSDSLYLLTEIFFRLSSFIGVANFLIVLSYKDTLFWPRKFLRAEWDVQVGFFIQKPNGSFELLLCSLLFERSPLPLLLNRFRSLG